MGLTWTDEFRADAIRNDKLIQVIGRGAGINRIAGNPLEVHILADVALPLSHHSTPARITRSDGAPRTL